MKNPPAPRDDKSTLASPLQLYLREISRYPLLSPEEEYQLAVQQFEEGDIGAAHRLITANLRLVVKIANDFRMAQVNILDLIQEGNHGLMQAVKRFNPYKGIKLSSYSAWWIRAYILKHLMDQKSHVKIGTTAAQRKLYYNLRREAEKLLAQFDSVDTKLLAANLDVREKDVIEMQQRLSSPDLYLDAPISQDPNSARVGDTLVVDAVTVEDSLVSAQEMTIFKEHLSELESGLQGRDLEVFALRIIAENPLTLQELGTKYGITRERARQLEARVLKKLKEIISKKGLLTR